MTVVGLRRLALWMGLVTMTACGGPLPEEMGSSEEAVTYEELSVENEGSSEANLATCPFEYAESCSADRPICAAKCCNGERPRSIQFCGNCTTWSQGACLNRGGVRYIEWHAQ